MQRTTSRRNHTPQVKSGNFNYDYTKLIGRIVEKCGNQAAFAKRMNLSERSVSLKLNNKVSFKQPEIQTALDVLDLKSRDIQTYFFTQKVQELEHFKG